MPSGAGADTFRWRTGDFGVGAGTDHLTRWDGTSDTADSYLWFDADGNGAGVVLVNLGTVTIANIDILIA